jgi:hypothetical protein
MNVVEEVRVDVVHRRAGMGYQIIVDLHRLVKGVILKDAVQEVGVVNCLHLEVVEEQSIFARIQMVIESPGHLGVILDTGNLHSNREEPEIVRMTSRPTFSVLDLVKDVIEDWGPLGWNFLVSSGGHRDVNIKKILVNTKRKLMSEFSELSQEVERPSAR